MLRIADGESFVELDLVSIQGEPSPAAGDACVSMRCQSHGFSGHTDTWVTAPALRAFAQALIRTEATRKTSAELQSISPGDLELRIEPISSLGHFAVFASIALSAQQEHAVREQRVSIAFEFDPSQLTSAVKVPWIAGAAA